jgi:hypothetical protein
MFGNSIQGSLAEPSFLYLMMAAACFRQARRTRHPLCATRCATSVVTM